MTPGTVRVPIGKVEGRVAHPREDILAIEEPLEIRVNSRSLSITMRTPGRDFELAAGFLFAEGIISHASQVRGSTVVEENIIDLELTGDAAIPAPAQDRGFVMTSACGVCGKASLEALEANRCPDIPAGDFKIEAGVLHQLPQQLRRRQDLFESTGGLHAAALFDAQGELESLCEDVGRHNAVDKLVGSALLSFRTPLRDSLMLVSGRASFELIQKAAMAGVPLLAAVGAPSSLAVATAGRCGMTLVGFLRNRSFNVYSEKGRIAGLEPEAPDSR
jgi:FdhD protein